MATPPEPATAPIVGIDLGTTNSLVAVMGVGADPSPRVLADAGGGAMLPSVVRFSDDGSVTIGRTARDESVHHPQWTVSSVKRLMGRSLRDAAADVPYLSYRVVEGEHATARVALPNGRVVSPQEASAIILSRLREIAEKSLGVEIAQAVITVPAYFDDAQRQATRDAGRLAGLDVVRIINEPTAAALAYGLGLRADGGAVGGQNIVVFDLGGGTFDVSVLRIAPGEAGGADAFQVLATAGDTHLGGDDMDHALVELFTREIREKLGGGATEFPAETRQALRLFAERVKVRLSTEETATIRIDLGDAGAAYERTVTRAELETLIAPLVNRAMACVDRALRDATRELAGETATAVVMVGGATRIPLVRRRVAERFGFEPYTALDPDKVVALGAAVQGAMMTARRPDRKGGLGSVPDVPGMLLLDVVPLSLGIETAHGAYAKIIMRNSPIPTRASERFSTSIDGQTSVKVHVLQGEREMAADCRSLGVFHLSGIPPMPAGVPRLKVDFAIDASGVLSVQAVEERSGKRAAVQIVPSHGLSREEVDRLERESFAHARDDMQRHRVADLIANAKLDVHWISRGLDKTRLLLEPAYVADLESRVAALKAMIDAAQRDWRTVDANAFHAAKEDLDKASARMHEVSIAVSLKGGAA